MARPTVSDAAEELYAALGPFAALDEDQDWHLLHFCGALADGTIEQIHTYVTDDEDTVGWSILLDPEAAPDEALEWLGQFVGVRKLPDQSADSLRTAILLPVGFERGRPASLEQAVRDTLTGSQTILVDERYLDSAYKLRVRTLASETPDEAATLAAILTQKPIGVVLTYDAITVWDWGDLQADHADWTDVMATFDTWLEARTQLP